MMERQGILNFKLELVALMCVLWLAACTSGMVSAVPTATTVAATAAPPLTATVSVGVTDTQTPKPTVTRTRLPITPIPSETLSALDVELTQVWTEIPTPSSRTPVAVAEGDSFRQDLARLGYQEYYSSSTTGPGGYIYSVYVDIDKSFQGFTKGRYPEMSYRIDQETEGCRMVFYRWGGIENTFLYSFAAPPGTYTYYPGYPAICMPMDWSDPKTYLAFLSIDFELYPALKLDGPWSDINHNSLPEFAMYYQYCSNGCLEPGAPAIHFYEIQSSARIVDITADLPGVVQPSRMIHAADPLELYVYDPILAYCYKWCAFDTWWIYGWDGEKLVDVTPKYADEIRQSGQEKVARIKKGYGQPLNGDEWQLLEILFVYEKAGLRNEALAQFMEVSDPKHWPADDTWFNCWLQSARAQAQEDYRLGHAFRFPPFWNPDSLEISLESTFKRLDASHYDLSACQALQKTPAP